MTGTLCYNWLNKSGFSKLYRGQIMEKEISGTVISVAKQWWLKVNTKPVRLHPLDGATFPHIIKAKYVVDGKEYVCRKWINAGCPAPHEGAAITIIYRADKPSKARIDYGKWINSSL